MLTKVIDGVEVEMDAEEEAAFIAQQQVDAERIESLADVQTAPIDPATRTGLKRALGLTDKQVDALLARAAELAN